MNIMRIILIGLSAKGVIYLLEMTNANITVAFISGAIWLGIVILIQKIGD